MAEDKKTSEMTDGGTVQATDDIPVVRNGVTIRVNPGSAATRAASDPTKSAVASVSGAITPGNMAGFADEAGTLLDLGPVPLGIEALLEAPPLTGVFLDDYIPVMQDGVWYRALVSDVLAATAPPSLSSSVLMEDGSYILQEDNSHILTEA